MNICVQIQKDLQAPLKVIIVIISYYRFAIVLSLHWTALKLFSFSLSPNVKYISISFSVQRVRFNYEEQIMIS